MAYEFMSDEPVVEGVRRIVHEEVLSAAERSKVRSAGEKDEAIHEIRKGVKRIRGLLKLMEPLLGDAYAGEAGTWRELGRRLSGLRDAGAMLGTLEELRERCPHVVHRAIRRRLIRSKREMEHKENVAAILTRVAGGLRRAEAKVKSWPLAGDGFEAIAPGLRKTYSRGLKALKCAEADPTPENLHKLRRRAKEHLFQMRLLKGLWNGKLRRHEEKVERLEEMLGSHQNLVVMKTKILEAPNGTGTAAEMEKFLEALEQTENELAAKALKMAGRVYDQSPARVEKDTKRLWAHWADL
jgi:CHAD domain-containing protein